MLFAITSATIPMPGKIKTYTSGCARNQKRCCQRRGLPPPLICAGFPETINPVGRKKLQPKTLSMSCMIAAASKGGNASNSRKPVTNCAQTKKGNRIQVIPGARNWMIVAKKFTAPRSDEVIRQTIPTTHQVCQSVGTMLASGEYD